MGWGGGGGQDLQDLQELRLRAGDLDIAGEH